MYFLFHNNCNITSILERNDTQQTEYVQIFA